MAKNLVRVKKQPYPFEFDFSRIYRTFESGLCHYVDWNLLQNTFNIIHCTLTEDFRQFTWQQVIASLSCRLRLAESEGGTMQQVECLTSHITGRDRASIILTPAICPDSRANGDAGTFCVQKIRIIRAEGCDEYSPFNSCRLHKSE